VLEQAVHHFDLWRFLLGSEVEEVFATSRSGEWDDETLTVTARLTNGTLAASVFAQRTADNHEVEICGRAGRLQVSCYRVDGLEFVPTSSYPGDIWTRLRRMTSVLKELPQTISVVRQGGDFVGSYRAEWRHFLDCIQHDTPVQCTLEDGRRALQVALAAAASASLRQPVKVAEAPRKITPVASNISVQSHHRQP
jgi:myo-inositol 2-dehydrogenase/D-chiro-inositol 1-dehydrogenase